MECRTLEDSVDHVRTPRGDGDASPAPRARTEIGATCQESVAEKWKLDARMANY
jgi:hypothetical protein